MRAILRMDPAGELPAIRAKDLRAVLAVAGCALLLVSLGAARIDDPGSQTPARPSPAHQLFAAQALLPASSPGARSLPAEVSSSIGHADRYFWVRRAGAALTANGGGIRASFAASGISMRVGASVLRVSLADAVGQRERPRTASPRGAAATVTYERGPLAEFYRNGPGGLEQGFTLRRGPRGRIALALTFAGSFLAERAGAQILFKDRGGRATLSYGGLRAVDDGGRALPTRLELRGRRVLIRIDGRDARYPIHVDPYFQLNQKLTGVTVGGAHKFFGAAAAISADASTVAVAQPPQGVVLVFTHPAGPWTRQAVVTAPAPMLNDAGVSLSANGQTLLVGSGSYTETEGAFVFTRSGDNWTQQGGALRPQEQSGQAGFDGGVDISDDGKTAIIGSPAEGQEAGLAWVFTLAEGKWTQQGKALSAGPGKAWFGRSVALSANGQTAIIGAPYGDNLNGDVWIYSLSGPEPQATKLTLSTGHYFGSSVALSADGKTALVGGEERDVQMHGAAWVFTQTGGEWRQVGKTLAPNDPSQSAISFGSRVALSGDGTTAVITGMADSNFRGAAWLFKPSGGDWVQDGKKLVPTEGGGGDFGSAASASYDGRLAVLTASGDNERQGAAWLFASEPPPAESPAVISRLATAVTHESATLQGAVDARGAGLTDCHFEYGPTAAYGSSAACAAPPAPGQGFVGVSAPITGLAAGGTYHFRIVATNWAGIDYGGDETFVAQEPPTVATEVASGVTHESATLNALVNPHGSEVTFCQFEYGTTTSYGSTVGCSPPKPGAGSSPVPVKATLSGLSANVVYHFRVVADNAGGRSYGRDLPLILEGGKLAQGEPYPQADSKGPTPGAIEVRNPPGTTVMRFTDEEISQVGLPAGAVQVVGGVSYQLGGFPAGSSFDAVFNLPPGSEPAKVFKNIKGTYVDVTSIATISGNTITMHVTDGGQGDEDGQANGVIVDPFVPVRFPAPVVTGVSPSAGSTAGGTSVVISGANLAGANSVKFGSSSATSFTVSSPNSITAVSPAGTGTVHVTVASPEGISNASPADRFNYVAPPVITKVKPTSGPVNGGTSVTITGTNLAGATGVKFNTSSAASFTVNSATSITAVSPAEPANTVHISVTTAGGTSAPSTKDRFKFLPTVTGVSPNGGSTSGGTSVAVTGTGFAVGTTATVFKFGISKARSVNCASTTTCTVVAPPHATGPVDVTATVNKVSSAKNAPADQFTYS